MSLLVCGPLKAGYHANTQVAAYLDHTGNPVSEALRSKPEETGELKLNGVIHTGDVLVRSVIF
ncbi:hypothetical protein D3C73_1601620 [compost metagenome]